MGNETPRERPLARTEHARPPPWPPFAAAAAAAPPPGSPGSLSVSHSVRHRQWLSQRAWDTLRRRSPREDPSTEREAEARSPIPSPRGGLPRRRAAPHPCATPFTTTSRGVPGLGDASREELGREAAAQRGCALWDSRGVSGGIGGGGSRSRGCLPASRLAGSTASPGRGRPPGPLRVPGPGAGARCAGLCSDRRRVAAFVAMIPPEPPQQQLQPPPPAPPNHVVTTIENLPAEGSGGGGGSLSASSRAGVRQRIRKVLNR